MIIAVLFTWKRCGWCSIPFTHSDGLCGYCSIECKDNHEKGASVMVKRNADGVYKCILS